MPTYTLRPTWPNYPDRADDYVIRYDGHHVGRLFKGNFPVQQAWRWTSTAHIGALAGASFAGLEPDMAAAKARFRENFEKLLAAGLIVLR